MLDDLIGADSSGEFSVKMAYFLFDMLLVRQNSRGEVEYGIGRWKWKIEFLIACGKLQLIPELLPFLGNSFWIEFQLDII